MHHLIDNLNLINSLGSSAPASHWILLHTQFSVSQSVTHSCFLMVSCFVILFPLLNSHPAAAAADSVDSASSAELLMDMFRNAIMKLFALTQQIELFGKPSSTSNCVHISLHPSSNIVRECILSGWALHLERVPEY